MDDNVNIDVDVSVKEAIMRMKEVISD